MGGGEGGWLQRDLEEVVARLTGTLDAEVKVTVHDVASGQPPLRRRGAGCRREEKLAVDLRFIIDPLAPILRLPAGARVSVETLRGAQGTPRAMIMRFRREGGQEALPGSRGQLLVHRAVRRPWGQSSRKSVAGLGVAPGDHGQPGCAG